MKFWHGCYKDAWDKTVKQGFLLHERHVYDEHGHISKLFEPVPCTYLATTKKEAMMYGTHVLEVEYDPRRNPRMNNYAPESWQMRVYEPIPIENVKLIQIGK